MAVPKRRTSHAKQGHRRSHHAVKPLQSQYCQNCSGVVQPHRICLNCGYFQGRIVVAEQEETGK
ncbi:50S ribosomal protein L32 [Zavarzinella formosa]|uniref:50S ribosomal protein L32 n=1 Tax=Zavarzinella formosa TaxID=360055 RepID=UPI000907D276|nr:50S ribosomal protein L32 [Zavarzinella formosa]